MNIIKMISLIGGFAIYALHGMSTGGASSARTEPFDQCCICQYDLDPSTAVIVPGTHIFTSPPCTKHQFHLICINACLKHGCRKCPLCRAPTLPAAERALLEAARTGNAAALAAAIAAGAHFDVNRGEALRTAIANQHFAIACDYIHRYAGTPSVDWQIPNMLAVVHYALQHDRGEILQDFADAHFSLTELVTQLLERNQFDQVQQFIERKRKILPTAILLNKEQLQSLLCDMARGGFVDAVRWLYDRYSGSHPALETALRLAVLNGHLTVVQYLAAQHLLPKLLTHCTELSAQMGHLEILQHLLQTYHLDKAPLAHMFIAAAKAGHVAVVQYLADRPELRAYIIDVFDIARGYDDPDHRDIMYNLIINQPENITILLEKITTRQTVLNDLDRDLDRAIIEYLIENRQLNQELIDLTAAKALENRRNNIAHYLIGGRHARLPQTLLFAQHHQWHHAVETLVTQYAPAISLEEAFINAVELDSPQTPDLMRLHPVPPHLQTQAILLATRRRCTTALATLLTGSSQEIISSTLLQAVSLDFLPTVETIIHHLISQGPLEAALHHELICRAVRSGHLETVRFLVDTLHFAGSLDQAIRWAHRYEHEDIKQYFITNHADKIDLPLFGLWTRTMSPEELTSSTCS